MLIILILYLCKQFKCCNLNKGRTFNYAAYKHKTNKVNFTECKIDQQKYPHNNTLKLVDISI